MNESETPALPTPHRASAGSTDAALPPEDLQRTVLFSCDHCGAELRFDIGAQALDCSHCGFSKKLESDPDSEIEERDYRELIRGLAERRKTAPGDLIHIPPGIAHQLIIEPAEPYMYLLFKLDEEPLD
jgi:hypothetical protein